MKIVSTIEYAGNSYVMDDVIAKVKEDWVSMGNKIKDLNAKLYLKVEESTVYYVVDEITYKVSL